VNVIPDKASKGSEYHFLTSHLIKEKCSSPNADLADYILSQYNMGRK